MKRPDPAGVVATFVSAVLSLILPASAMADAAQWAPRNDPILNSIWGPGDSDLVLPQFHVQLGRHKEQAAAYNLAIVAPVEDAIVVSDIGDVSVRATIRPGLADGDQVEFLVDGDPAGPPGRVLDLSLTGLVRGEHVLQARVIDSTGNVASVSLSTVFYVRR